MDSKERAAWLTFIDGLEAVQSKARDDEHRRRFVGSFKSELVLLSVWLNELGITGGEPSRAISPPEHCDLCGINLAINGLQVDGQIGDGQWSHMCLKCFGSQGVGLGWGAGQLYRVFENDCEGEPIWRCIAGGDPKPNDEYD